MSYLALDIGGSWFRWQRGDGNSGKIKTQDIPKQIVSLIDKDTKVVSISLAGLAKDGVVLFAPNLNLKTKNIASYIKDRFDVEVFIDNDLNLATLAESKFYKSDYIVAIYVGTGVGGGIVYDGKIISGSYGVGAEIGHLSYKNSPLKCGCGKSDCYELYCSGSGLAKWREYFGYKETELKDMINSKDKSYDVAKNFIEALAHLTGSMTTIFNPEIIVYGGGIVESNRYIVDLVLERLPKYTLSLPLRELKLEVTQLRNAPLLGAVLRAEEFLKAGYE